MQHVSLYHSAKSAIEYKRPDLAIEVFYLATNYYQIPASRFRELLKSNDIDVDVFSVLVAKAKGIFKNDAS